MIKKGKSDKKFLKQPYFEGGDKAIREFISMHLKYPEMALKQKIEGDVHLRYEIDYKGNVIDVKVIGGFDPHCDAEAIRVVKLLKFKVPKIPRHLKVTFHKTINIHFRINANIPTATFETEKQTENQVSNANSTTFLYTYTTPNNTQKKEPQTYTYTVKSS